MNRPLSWRLAALPLTAVLSLVGAASAGAHEPRTSGALRFVVGWGDEPTYTGYKNSVQLMVTDAQGDPVNDLGDAVEVEVVYGEESTLLPMGANFVPGAFGEEGDYRAWLTPTEAGEYTFRFTGSYRGQDIDEEFTSGPDTFGSPVDVQEIQFPTREPSTGELAQRMDRELSRMEGGVEASSPLTIVALVVAIAALLASGGALMSSRRRAPTSAPADERVPERV